jgi:hypothetical protein
MALCYRKVRLLTSAATSWRFMGRVADLSKAELTCRSATSATARLFHAVISGLGFVVVSVVTRTCDRLMRWALVTFVRDPNLNCFPRAPNS